MSKLIAGALLLAVFVLAESYDFENPDYNQVLARDWEELQEDETPIHHRTRRDDEDKCKKRRLKFCCADDAFEAMHEEDKPLKKECYKQITGKEKAHYGGFHGHDPFKCDKDKVDKHRAEMLCVMQCVGQKKDVLDANGDLKEDNVRKTMKERLAKETWLTPKLDAMLEMCLKEAKRAPEKEAAGVDKKACNGAGMRFGHCMWKELQFSCPADQIRDQKACDKVRDRIRNHPDFPFPAHKHDEE